MKQWVCALSLFVLVVTPFVFLWSDVHAQEPAHPVGSDEIGPAYSSHDQRPDGSWEGSAQGVAYSEFNHRFAGLFNLLFGLSELGHALRYPLPLWTRLILPSALGIIGAFLLVWSDHDAWPIGSLSFLDTFFGQNHEILQHKFYGVFAAIAAVGETLRRIGWARHPAWAAPLVLFGVIGGLLLFAHSHGSHPAHQTIELHHALLGSLGICAALSKAMASWMPRVPKHPVNRWELAWAVFVILIGLQLILYFE